MQSDQMKTLLKHDNFKQVGTNNSHGPNPMKPLFSDVGDLQKSSDKLMFALISQKFPGQYDEQQALNGHPSMYMKILHYVIFFSSNAVKNYLYSKEIDPNTIHYNDQKFMERIFYILTSLLGLKPRIRIHQFFKYGFAEQKMMMCVDTIKRVKELSKEIRRNISLISTRKKTIRSNSASTIYERSASAGKFNQSRVKVKITSLAEVQEDMKNDFKTQTQKEAQKHLTKKNKRTRKESLECSMRLTGSQAYQTINRHRYPNESELVFSNENPLADTQSDKLISTIPLRYRGVQVALEGNGELSFTHAMKEDLKQNTGHETTLMQETTKSQTLIEVAQHQPADKEVNHASVDTAEFADENQAQQNTAEVSKTAVLLQLQQSIQQMSSKMQQFEHNLTGKIDQLDGNYQQLNSRLNKMEVS